MSKLYLILFDFLDGQEKWLNSMAERGPAQKCGR